MNRGVDILYVEDELDSDDDDPLTVNTEIDQALNYERVPSEDTISLYLA
jgi:hypothetical protein